MGVIKRDILYLLRKKEQTLTLFLLIMIISVFLLVCFSLLELTDGSARNMRSAVGGSLKIYPKPDFSAEKNGSVIEDMDNISPVNKKQVDSILKDEKIEYFNAYNSGYCKSDNINFIPGSLNDEDNNMGYVKALNFSSLDDEFGDKTLELIEGRHITDKDKNVIIISKELADANKIKTGDVIKFTHSSLEMDGALYVDGIKNKTKYEKAKVIGIYDVLKPQVNSELQPTAGLLVNQIFADHNFSNGLAYAKKDEYKGGVEFFINDPLKLDDTVGAIEKSGEIDDKKFLIKTNDFNYKKIKADLGSIQNLVFILLVCSSIVCLVILMLVLFLRMRGRLNEVGILVAMGNSKLSIATQFLLEVIVLAAIAFMFSYFISYKLSMDIANNIINDLDYMNISTDMITTGKTGSDENLNLFNSEIYKVFLIYTAELFVLMLAVLTSSIAVMRQKPKEILSRMS